MCKARETWITQSTIRPAPSTAGTPAEQLHFSGCTILHKHTAGQSGRCAPRKNRSRIRDLKEGANIIRYLLVWNKARTRPSWAQLPWAFSFDFQKKIREARNRRHHQIINFCFFLLRLKVLHLVNSLPPQIPQPQPFAAIDSSFAFFHLFKNPMIA